MLNEDLNLRLDRGAANTTMIPRDNEEEDDDGQGKQPRGACSQAQLISHIPLTRKE